ncbi:hypothetical protein [Homoserinibacter sp. YIM 151385]|uniref:hypothetical protein n=1 Tax=Homoserinibacter sp. YIM 151385 TaxID=2985506 RepID=UPI0022EFE61F|nr:hypothetical protein [Homoserinibacter sp. YIM 151385]WBU39109.1 hypothetical protein OF852_05910 [Homoserinibacter sp. YIM 151385]
MERDGENSTGNQSDSAEAGDLVDTGQSDDIQSSLNQQGGADRETIEEIEESEGEQGGDSPKLLD